MIENRELQLPVTFVHDQLPPHSAVLRRGDCQTQVEKHTGVDFCQTALPEIASHPQQTVMILAKSATKSRI